MKTCSKCLTPKSPDDFGKDRSQPGGRSYYCSACKRALRAVRAEALRALKAGPCVDCNGSFQPCAMDFDHREPSKKVGKIARLGFQASWGEVLAEVAKCTLICACCHRLRTYKGDTSYHTRQWKYHRTIVDELKATVPCADCGRKLKPCQMDFDHSGPKTTNVSWLLGAPKEELLAEIEVCHIVCANCHRVRTHTGQRPALHSECLIAQFNEIASRIEYPQDERLVRSWHGLVGTMTDAEVAEVAGVTRSAVSCARRKAGVPSFHSSQGSP